MSKTVDIYTATTNTIIETITNGAGTWTMPWSNGTEFPTNPTTGTIYRGANVLTLLGAASTNHYPSGQWATYKQWTAIGAQVRRGEHGTACIWWNVTDQARATVNNNEKNTADERASRVIARPFTLFNAAQVDGYEPTPHLRDTPEQITHAEQFFTAIGAHVIHRNDGIAAYLPEPDLIVLPPLEAFLDAPSYYATSAHEHAHWTGHHTRLDRDLTGRFGSHSYAAEELVAELSAAFTCAVLGISPTPRPDHAAYLAHWLEILRADPRALHTIAGKAQAATDHLRAVAAAAMATDLDDACRPLTPDAQVPSFNFIRL